MSAVAALHLVLGLGKAAPQEILEGLNLIAHTESSPCAMEALFCHCPI